METTFNVKDFIIRILRKWRLLISMAVIFAVIFGGFKGLKGYKTLNSGGIQETATESEKSLNLKSVKENAKESVKRIRGKKAEWDSYYADSDLMEINPYQAERYVLILHIESQQIEKSVETASIAQVYKKEIENGKFYEKLSQKTGIETGEFQELIRASVEESVIEVKGYQFKDIDMKQIISELYKILEEDFNSRYGNNYILNKASESYYNGKDEELVSYIGEVVTYGDRYIAGKKTRESELAELEELSPEAVIVTPSTIIKDILKFGIIGGILGFICSIIFALIQDLMSSKLSDQKELQKELNLKCLAGRCILTDSKLNFIDKKIEKLNGGIDVNLTETQWVEYVSERIKMENIRDLVFVGTILQSNADVRLQLLIASLNEKGILATFGGNIISREKALEKMTYSENVVLIESIGTSDRLLIEEEVNILRDLNKNMLGFILV